MLCLFGDEHAADLTLGKQVMEALFEHAPDRKWTLLWDRGFIDGQWIGELKRKGVDVVIGVKSNMHLYEDALGLTLSEDTTWHSVPAPKYEDGERPQRRVTGWQGFETWNSCPVPLSAAVIVDWLRQLAEDRFSDRTKRYVIAGTEELEPVELHEQFRKRWEIEEAFMALKRYWNIDDLGSCRHEVYLAQVYFALLRVFSDRYGPVVDDTAPVPGQELVVYWRDRYAILLPSELFGVVFENFERWRANRQRLLEAMRHCEGRPPP